MVEKAILVSWSFFLAIGVFLLCIAIFAQIPGLILVVGSWFILLCYMAYLRLVKKRKPKYPLVPPEGKPDVYTGLPMPRPIYEDMQRYPEFFRKKKEEVQENKKSEKEDLE